MSTRAEQAVAAGLEEAARDSLGGSLLNITPVPGGDIHQSYYLELSDCSGLSEGIKVFAKTNDASNYALLEQELLALQVLEPFTAIKTPRVLACGVIPPASSSASGGSIGMAYLLLEWLELGSYGDQALLGQQLARLHRQQGADYGWMSDNFIGLMPQCNTWHSSWAEFWRECRLQPQLSQAINNGARELKPYARRVLAASDTLLAQHQPEASLLHGDLWAGNKAFVGADPVIFDPASYYGDREADLAMTHIFGGFNEDFYRAYSSEWPLPRGVEQRLPIYKLYHLLNHLNLFGAGYLDDCLRVCKTIIKSVEV